MEDKLIVDLLWQRSEQAIEELQRAYQGYCSAISWRILQDAQDVEECLNDTWMAIWKAIPPARPTDLRSYTAKTVRNLSINLLLGNHAKKRSTSRLQQVYEDLEEMAGGENPIDAWVDEKAFTGLLNGFLQKLSPMDRGIFVLRFWYLYTPKEIAKQYKIKEKTVYNALYRLKKQFQSYWKEEVSR